MPPHYTINEYEIWIRRHRIDDLQRRIAMNDWEMVDADVRSPSPEPIYDAKTGLRMNTKEQRFRDKYVRERNSLIQEVLQMDPTYEVTLYSHLTFFRPHPTTSRLRSTRGSTFPTQTTPQ